MASKLTLTVSQLNEYIRRMMQLDPMLHGVELKGEISNLKFHQTGTIFFTLKDELSSIACVMYASDAANLQAAPFEGMRVVVSGSVGFYVKGGQLQFYANRLQAQGVGVLYERLMALREKLSREGLFAAERKRALPALPDTIGVVTSPTGAVIHDIMNVSLRRNPDTKILLCPVRVQGVGAADEVVQAIELLEQIDAVSVIIVARGGGSIEDLWTFNEEAVVRAVAACNKPVVSAVGHETDVTLCDLAADLRAPTPSAAAECVVPLMREIKEELTQMKAELDGAIQWHLERKQAALKLAFARLALCQPKKRIEEEEKQLARAREMLRQAMDKRWTTCLQLLEQRRRELAMLSPYRVLERGFAIVTRDGLPVTSCSQLKASERIAIRFSDGVVSAQVLAQSEKEG